MGGIDLLGKVDGTILTVASGDLADATTSYTYFNMLQEDYKYFILDFTIVATTLTLEGSNSSVGVADASAVWVDITDEMFDVASETATGTWICDSPCPFKRLRVKRLTTNSTNSLTLRLTRSR